MLLFLRHGGQLSSEAPSMGVISKNEMADATKLHATTQYFHSDFAHTDYIGAEPFMGADPLTTSGSASWTTPPLDTAVTLLSSRIKMKLWVATNAVSTEFSASLSHWTAETGWVSLCGSTGSTLHREGAGKALPLPGKDMMATSANGGFPVELTLELDLPQKVELRSGDMLRVDVSRGPEAAAATEERVDHRIWHSPKWVSSLELELDPQASGPELKFEAHPLITQPEVVVSYYKGS